MCSMSYGVCWRGCDVCRVVRVGGWMSYVGCCVVFVDCCLVFGVCYLLRVVLCLVCVCCYVSFDV